MGHGPMDRTVQANMHLDQVEQYLAGVPREGLAPDALLLYDAIDELRAAVNALLNEIRSVRAGARSAADAVQDLDDRSVRP